MFLAINRVQASFHTTVEEALDVAKGGGGFEVWALEDIRRVALASDGKSLIKYHANTAFPIWRYDDNS